MAETIIKIAAVGDDSNGINEIDPEFQSEALRHIRGIDCGVLDNSFYNSTTDPYGIKKDANNALMFQIDVSTITQSTGGIQIGKGMATAYGYDFRLEGAYLVTEEDDTNKTSIPTRVNSVLSSTTALDVYLFVYLEWDCTSTVGVGSVKVHDNGSAGIWRSMTQQNLITNQGGKYQLPIWRVHISSSNNSIETTSWEDMNLCPTITRPQVAEVARFAETKDAGDNSDAVANTKYVDSAIEQLQLDLEDTLNELYANFNSGSVSILGVPFSIYRQNGLVYIEGDYIVNSGQPTRSEQWTQTHLYDLVAGTTIGTLPSWAKPQKNITVRIGFYYYLAAGTYGTITVWATFNTNLNITIYNIEGTTSQGSANYPYFAVANEWAQIGYKCTEFVAPDFYPAYRLNRSVPSNVILTGLPDHLKQNTTYTFKAFTKDYSKEVSHVTLTLQYTEDVGAGDEQWTRTVFEWDKDNGVRLGTGSGDGIEFTTNTGSVSSSQTLDFYTLTITSRWYGDGTPDE